MAGMTGFRLRINNGRYYTISGFDDTGLVKTDLAPEREE